MAINFTDFSRAPVQDLKNPLASILEDAFKGYQMGRAPAQMNEEQTARQLANRLKEMEAAHKPKEFELSDQHQALVNAMQSEALKYLPEQRKLDREYKEAQIQDLLNKGSMNPLQLAEAKEEIKLKVKDKKEYEDLARHLINTAADVQGLTDLFGTEKNPKSPTGILESLKRKLGIGSEELGKFNERALQLQKDLARQISERGGAVAAKIAEQGKPSQWSSRAHNIGILKGMRERTEREFKQLQEDYKRTTGKELPYTLEDIFHAATLQAVKMGEGKESPQKAAKKFDWNKYPVAGE